jgi:branched-chain amino acid transport system substrate-binding protein
MHSSLRQRLAGFAGSTGLALIGASFVLAAIHGQAQAADRVKVGLVTTLSGPGAVDGNDIRDAFQLFLKLKGDKLGGLPAELVIADDAANGETGKQVVDRLIKRDRVDLLTGIIFSSVLLPAWPTIAESGTFYVSPNTGPQDLAGERCSPFFFSTAWQNEEPPAAMGQHVQDRGYKYVVGLAPNYAGGRETLAGFKRTFKGRFEEVYSRMGQVDYAAEISQIRALKPDAIFVFLPGGMGINFLKQYSSAGLAKDVQLFLPGFTADEDTLGGTGDTLLGAINSSEWAHDMDNAANQRFVSEFQKAYGRLPSMYAAQSYDAAQLYDAAIRDSRGRIDDKDAFRAAMRAARFDSVRGKFRFNRNHMPIQDYYLRVVTRDSQGRVTNRLLNRIYADRGDAFAASCPMKW